MVAFRIAFKSEPIQMVEIETKEKLSKEKAKQLGELIVNGAVRHFVEQNPEPFENGVYQAALKMLQKTSHLPPKELEKRSRSLTQEIVPYLIKGTAATVKFIGILLLEAALEKTFPAKPAALTK